MMKQKPVVLWPAILAYHFVLLPIHFFRYILVGLFVTLYVLGDILVSIWDYIIKYLIYGFIVMCYLVFVILTSVIFKFPMYVFLGTAVIFFGIRNGIYTIFIKPISNYQKKKTQQKNIVKAKKQVNVSNKKVAAAKKANDKIVANAKQKKKKEKDVFINDKEKLEKKSFIQKLGHVISLLSPRRLVSEIKDNYENSSLVRYVNNKRIMDKEAMLINFEGKDAERSETKNLYEYLAKNEDGKVIKGYAEAYSKVEVHSYLLSEGMTVYRIRTNKWITLLHSNAAATKTKIKNKDLIFFLTQLSTYLKAGITLVESLKILSRQYKNKKYQKIFKTIVYDLTMGDNLSEAMEKEGDAFPRLLINMVKTSEMTGELPEVLDDMANHYSKIDKTKKEMINALLYPALVFVVAIGVVVFIMLFVIPKFVEIYESMDASSIPAFTLFILNLSAFLKKNIILIVVITILVIIAIILIYKNVKPVRTVIQWFAMHLPVFGNVIIYNEVTMFTKTLSSLLKHSVPIAESMDILNKMTNNEIYKMLILNTITNIYKGDKISDAFKNQWSFPIPAYEMIVTGERTGELPEMMEKVANYYQTLQESSVTRIKTFIEPILIIFLTTIVGAIVLAIIIPMFNMYSAIQ